MSSDLSFGQWLKRRRQALGMTRDDLARRVGYSVSMLRKVEGDERVPSRQLVELLAEHLDIATAERVVFLSFARDDLTVDPPPIPTVVPVLARPTRLSNLPTPPTPLIGRERELQQLENLLRCEDVRLVTLTGPGGIGKTRLGLQVAADLLDTPSPNGSKPDFDDGVYFVNLAPISDSSLVAYTIAQTLEVREQAGRPLLATLKDFMAQKTILLLLDNFEQVGDAASFVAELLAAAPGLKVLVTSRVPLHVRGEREVSVPPLALPDIRTLPASPSLVLNLSEYEAVQLFVERAVAVKTDFALTTENAVAVAEICQRLDGLPLAIELAAARCKVFPPQALLSRLDSRLKLLIGGPRDVPARQRTLRSTIDWSYHLLGEAETTLFRRLAVFVGGGSLEAIEAICDVDGDLAVAVLAGVESLVDKSLLQQREGMAGEARFWMLETIHEYARERLAESGEEAKIQRQHANFFMALAEVAEPKLKSAQQAVWLRSQEVEHDNFRTALRWAHAHRAYEVGARLACALKMFWVKRGYESEGRGWLSRLLTEEAQSTLTIRLRANTLFHTGDVVYRQGDYIAGRALLEASFAMWEQVGDKHGLAEALVMSGYARLRSGDPMGATEVAAKSVALFGELGDEWELARALHCQGVSLLQQGRVLSAREVLTQSYALWNRVGDIWGIGLALKALAQLALAEGRYDEARTRMEQGLVRLQEVGDKWIIAHSLHLLGVLSRLQDSLAEAEWFFCESIRLHWELGQKPGIVEGLEGLVGVGAARNQFNHASRLLGAAEAICRTYSAIPQRADYNLYAEDIERIRHGLGEDSFGAARAEGQTMTLEQVVAFALEERD